MNMPEADAERGPKAVFVDKDGTLVVDVPYNVDPARLTFTPHAPAALRVLDAAGYAIFVATNQRGLADRRFTLGAYAALQEALADRMRDEAGVELAGFLTCPHAPDAAGAPLCGCRKPAPGLLREAAAVHGLDLSRCWMVGDILDDVEAGRRAGCRTVLLDVGNETEWLPGALRVPHHRCGDLLEAARCIVAADSGATATAALAEGR